MSLKSTKKATEQTPIEIALGIDADGMTTARKLYAFLELAPQHFARWCKKNITENDFATENEDYTRLTTNGETPTGGKVEREDYRLTAQFAKKLFVLLVIPCSFRSFLITCDNSLFVMVLFSFRALSHRCR